jgi:hypothetical protein
LWLISVVTIPIVAVVTVVAVVLSIPVIPIIPIISIILSIPVVSVIAIVSILISPIRIPSSGTRIRLIEACFVHFPAAAPIVQHARDDFSAIIVILVLNSIESTSFQTLNVVVLDTFQGAVVFQRIDAIAQTRFVIIVPFLLTLRSDLIALLFYTTTIFSPIRIGRGFIENPAVFDALSHLTFLIIVVSAHVVGRLVTTDLLPLLLISAISVVSIVTDVFHGGECAKE